MRERERERREKREKVGSREQQKLSATVNSFFSRCLFIFASLVGD